MTAKQLREWINTVHDDAVIEVERYSWISLDPKNIRATYQSSPPVPERVMADVCNLEEAPT
jgi:hypothetical protein